MQAFNRTFHSRPERLTVVIFLNLIIPARKLLLDFLFMVREYFLSVNPHTVHTENVNMDSPVRISAIMVSFRPIKLFNENFIQADNRNYLLTGVKIPVMNTFYFGEYPESGTTVHSRKYGISLLINCLNEQKSNSYSRIWQTNKDRVN